MLQVTTTRADNVELIHKNEMKVTKFPNGAVFTSMGEGITAGVRIECPGYATVTYSANQANQSDCMIDFNDGFQIECDCSGNYKICNDSKLRLSLLSQGQALYTSPSGGKYSLDYSGKGDILNATDSSGQRLKVDLHGEAGSTVDSSKKSDLYDIFKPRIFAINADGTGFEVLESARMKEIVELAESETNTTIVQDIAIPGTSCRSTVIMHPMITNKDEYVNTLFHSSLSLQVPSEGQKSFRESADIELQGYNSSSLEERIASRQSNCHQFLTFDPLSDQKRDIILKGCFVKWQSEVSNPQHLQKLWHTSVKATSESLIDYATQKVEDASHQEKLSHSVNRDLLTQRETKLRKTLHAIREGFIPGYFNDDSENQQAHALITKSQPRLSDLTSHTFHVDSVSTGISLDNNVAMASKVKAPPYISMEDSKQSDTVTDYVHQLQVTLQ